MPDTHDWIILSGSAVERGQQQAERRPDLADRVRSAVAGRLDPLGTALKRPEVLDFLQAQREFLRSHDRPGFDESRGIALGYRLQHDDLLAYLHANIVADMDASLGAPVRPDPDGCTAWAHAAGHPALVVKNRDYRGEHGVLQQVFLHRDPQWQERMLVCVGSLGSPGAFSSGMNTDGLAVADTQIGTRDHGIGWLRYFLMTALLRECRDVPQALAFLRSAPHAGGGALVMGDRAGGVAAVTLGHQTPSVVTQSTHWVAHTNHCTDPDLARDERLPQGDPTDCTFTRLQQVQAALADAGGHMDVAQARALMASHRDHGGICRHAQGDTSRTLSCVVYDTHTTTLHMSHGNPCQAPWSHYDLAQAFPAAGRFRVTTTPVHQLIGEHSAIVALRQLIARVALSKAGTVLIYGETGTGKGLVARMIHQLSQRAANPFIDINCAAIPAELLESELFGHERGAFTGAVGKKEGLIEAANGGSVFLDEVRELDPVMQAKILTLLDNKRFRRVGAVTPIDVDVRFIAATNKILLQEVQAGKFRDDLYYRLQVIAINIPPLRDRGDDILLLAHGFLHKYHALYGGALKQLDPEVTAIFRAYRWPGNVRELENLMERICLLEDGGWVQKAHIPARILREVAAPPAPVPAAPPELPDAAVPFHDATQAFQRRLIERALQTSRHNLGATAASLGLTRHALRHQLLKLGVTADG